MSELSARLGLYAAIDRAAAEDDGCLRLAGQVIALYRRDVDADGDRRPANPDGTAGWAAHLDALLPGVEVPDLDQALAELADLAEVSELDQARRLKALWAAARVLPEVRNAGNLPSVADLLRPLVQTARGDDSSVEDGLERLTQEVLDSDRFTTADPWSDLTQVAVDHVLISARVAELANLGCDDWVTLVPVASATGVTIDPAMPVHPTFLYESIWCFVGLALLVAYIKKRKFNGDIALRYLVWYGAGRFWIESLRTDSLLLVPSLGLRASQLVAAAAVVGGVALEIFLTRKYKSKPLMVTLALTAENRSLLAKVRKAEPEFTVEREELVASSPRKLFLERTNAYNERVKQQLKEKLAEKN